MRVSIFFYPLAFLALTSCVKIPQESIDLSELMGKDLEVLHESHRNMVNIHYTKVEKDIDVFIKEVYSPFVINYVLKVELKKFQAGDSTSIFSALIEAGQENASSDATNLALKKTTDFQEAAHRQIQKKRQELLKPIIEQKKIIMTEIDKSYEKLIYANATITGHLRSIKKVRDAQKEALKLIGLEGLDEKVTSSLTKLSNQIENAVEKGKEIDEKAENAGTEIEALI